MARPLLPLALLLLWGPAAAQVAEPGSVVVEGDDARTRVTFYRPDVVRVDWEPAAADTRFSQPPDTSLAVVRQPGEAAEAPDVRVRETADGMLLRTGALTVAVQREPLRLRFYDDAGRELAATAAGGGFVAGDTTQTVQFDVEAGTHFYGTGERGGSVDLRGRAFASYNTQQYGYLEAPATMKINVPLLTTSGGYALFFDSPVPGYFDVGATRPDLLRYAAAEPAGPGREPLTYYLIAGETPREQLEAYTWLTGRQPLPPRWALGFIQSKYGYRTAEAALAAVDTFKQRDIPISGLVLDLYWFDKMGDLAWDRDGGWANPEALAAALDREGVNLITITETYLTRGSDLFDEALANGYVGTRADGEPYVMEGWWSCGPDPEDMADCDVALLDITDPEAQAWWWSQYPEFMDAGVDGFWTDLGEPERHPSDMLHDAGPARQIHNTYNLLWAKTLYENYDDWRPNERLFNLTRSGYAGIQRYGTALWSGDVARSFVTLDEQLPLMLNVGLSGLGYYSSDLGGFVGDLYSPELYARWLQMGAFTPTMRAHGVDNLPTEPWGFGPEAERIVRDYIRLRYRMLPYNYALARQNHEHGTPLARPLFTLDPADERLLTYDDAFLWGDAFLVAPVTEEGARTQTVYLPRGTWTDYWTGARLEGGQEVTVEAPLERLPVFVKAGSIVPMRPEVQPMEAPFDALVLDVFPHVERPATFTLYEDDGQTQDYAEGAYAKTRIVQRWEGAPGTAGTLTLDIGPAAGTYDGAPQERLWRADVRRVGAEPASVRFDGQPLPRHDSPEALAASEAGGYAYDADTQRLVMQHRAPTDRSHQFTAEGAPLAE